MNICVIQGSPHKNGSSNLLASEFIRGARENGHNITVLDAAHMDLHPCQGCEYCGMNGPCIWDDDNNIIRDTLLNADMAVFVTPVYYFGPSAQLKTVIDRFYSYTTRLSGKRLKTVLITAAWDSNDDVMPALVHYYDKLCRYMNFKNCGMVLGTGCGTPYMTKRSSKMNEAYQLGKSVK